MVRHTLWHRANPKMLHLLFLMFCASPGSGMPDEMEENKYVIGGQDTNITEVPYQAALFIDNEFMCGATIVGKRYLLTAAHCIPSKHSKYWIRVGSSFKDKGGETYNIKRAVKHPSYNSLTKYEYDYDVAFLEVEKPIKFNAKVKPIPVVRKEPKAGAEAKISGYGKDDVSGHFPEQLQSLDVSILDRTTCNCMLGGNVSQRMICTTSKREGTCAYKGDSGGPLVVNGKVAGAVSYFRDEPCKLPFVYSNFAEPKIRKFIKKHTGV